VKTQDTTGRGRRAAFTLLELVTVVAILGILLSMLVVGATDIMKSQRIANTKAMLRVLGTSLENYARDYNDLYPYTSKSGSMMSPVAADLMPTPSDATYKEEVALYLAITAKRRHGPYYTGSEINVKIVDKDKGLRVFADAWDRPFVYSPPVQKERIPRLKSLGPNPATDPTGSKDDITNYGLD